MKIFVLLLFALVAISPVSAQPDDNDAAKAGNPEIPLQGWDTERLQANFGRNVREYLAAAGVRDKTIQDAVLQYFHQTTTLHGTVTSPTGLELQSAVMKLVETFRDEDISGKEVAARVVAHDAAMEKSNKHRQLATQNLDENVGFSKNPELRAALILLGIGTDAPPFIGLGKLYGLDADNLPRTIFMYERFPDVEPTSANWVVWDDPAHYQARKRWQMAEEMYSLMTKYGIMDKAKQDSVLTYIKDRERAGEDLAALAVPLYANLITPEPQRKTSIIALLAEYKQGLQEYSDQIDSITETLEAATNYSMSPRLSAILYFKGGLGGTRTPLWDGGTGYWRSIHVGQLSGRNGQAK